MEMNLRELRRRRSRVDRGSQVVGVVVPMATGFGVARGVRLRRQHRTVSRCRTRGHERRHHRTRLQRSPCPRDRRGPDGARCRRGRRRDGPRDPHCRRADRHRGLRVAAQCRRHPRRRDRLPGRDHGGRFEWLAPPLFEALDRYSRSAGTMVAIALAFTLAFAELADLAKLAPIVGAFVAGPRRSVATDESERIRVSSRPVGHLFIPVFFLADRDRHRKSSEFFRPVGARHRRRAARRRGRRQARGGGRCGSVRPATSCSSGIGMIPRGEVGLIFATIGSAGGRARPRSLRLAAARGARDDDGDAAAPAMAPHPDPRRRGRRADVTSPSHRVDGCAPMMASSISRLRHRNGWRSTSGCDAALAMFDGRPGNDLLDWLGGSGERSRCAGTESTRPPAVACSRPATSALAIPRGHAAARARASGARRGDATPARRPIPARSRAAAAVLAGRPHPRARRRRSACGGPSTRRSSHPEWLLLAALILDTAGDDDVTRRARPTAREAARPRRGRRAGDRVLLEGDSNLMRADGDAHRRARRRAVFQLAVHLDRPERARALYLLTLALGELDAGDRGRLDELRRRCSQLLEQEDLTGLEARNTVERRRRGARALGDDPLADRADPRCTARLPARTGGVRRRPAGGACSSRFPAVTRSGSRVRAPDDDGPEWRVEVACRDRAGLLAMVAGVLADHGVDVLDAVVATWPDDGALESFRVQRAGPAPRRSSTTTCSRRSVRLTAIGSRRRSTRRSTRRSVSPPNPEADVRFDDDASPWYTLCEVRSPDRAGLAAHDHGRRWPAPAPTSTRPGS